MMRAGLRMPDRVLDAVLAHADLSRQEMYPFTLLVDLSSLTMPLTVMRQVMRVGVALRTQVGEERGVSRSSACATTAAAHRRRAGVGRVRRGS